MSAESAWDDEVVGDDVQRLLAQCDGYSRKVAELEAEVERLRPLADMGQAIVDHAQPAEEFFTAAERFSRVVNERNEARAEVAQLNDLVAGLRQRLAFHEGRAAETLRFGDRPVSVRPVSGSEKRGDLTDEELAEMRTRLRHRATCQAQPWNDERPCTCNAAADFDRLRNELVCLREERDIWLNRSRGAEGVDL